MQTGMRLSAAVIDRWCPVPHTSLPRAVVVLQTVEELAGHLRSARRIMIVGNGGIALGLVHEVRGGVVLASMVAPVALSSAPNTLCTLASLLCS